VPPSERARMMPSSIPAKAQNRKDSENRSERNEETFDTSNQRERITLAERERAGGGEIKDVAPTNYFGTSPPLPCRK
jgi:hypothetical protein